MEREMIKLSPYSGIPERLKLYRVMAAYAKVMINPLEALVKLKEEYRDKERYEGIGISVDKILSHVEQKQNISEAIQVSFTNMLPEEIVLLKAYHSGMSHDSFSVLLQSIIEILDRVRLDSASRI